jgi:Na+/proline symporter
VLLALAIAYVGVLFAISAWSTAAIRDVEDYALAGRRLPLHWATATLLATWFGAGTLLTAADEVKARGLEAATLDPLGAGICLLLAGWFLAGPLWREKLTTLPELFGRRFGPRTEWVGGLMMIPTYLGWVAAQTIALGHLLELMFGLPLPWAIALVAAVGTGYTWVGGMWAVTLTDGLQIVLMVAGLLVMTVVVASSWLGDGWTLPAGHWQMIPVEPAAFGQWVGVLLAGSLGNLPSQDLMQRVFSSRSESVARRACLWAGGLYLGLGTMPVFLGLAAAGLDTPDASVLPALAQLLLHPVLAAIFMLTILSAVLSTIDSALLAPGTVLSENVLTRVRGLEAIPPLTRNRMSVVAVAVASLVLAYSGESAYGLLESTYELTMVALLAPLVVSVYGPARSEAAALAAMLLPSAVWAVHFGLNAEGFGGTPVPLGIGCTVLSFALLLGWPQPRPKEAS